MPVATLYRILRDFEQLGLVQCETRLNGDQERYYYTLTESGQAQYNQRRADFTDLFDLISSILAVR